MIVYLHGASSFKVFVPTDGGEITFASVWATFRTIPSTWSTTAGHRNTFILFTFSYKVKDNLLINRYHRHGQ